MAIDDDPIIVQARQVAEDVSPAALTIAQVVVNSVMNSIMPMHIGEAITGIIGCVSQQRWNQRVAELLLEFAMRVSELTEEIPKQGYYGSEEFQALLVEAIDQERTNRHKEKRRMLAAGLAKSGTNAHVQDMDKELYFRIMRDLVPNDLLALREAKKIRPDLFNADKLFGHQNILMGRKSLQMESIHRRLEGLGLMKSEVKAYSGRNFSTTLRDQKDIANVFNSILQARLIQHFHVSHFGNRFLAMMSDENSAETD